MIRRLWAGETVDGQGTYFRTKNAKLHTRPREAPPLYVSAFHPKLRSWPRGTVTVFGRSIPKLLPR